MLQASRTRTSNTTKRLIAQGSLIAGHALFLFVLSDIGLVAGVLPDLVGRGGDEKARLPLSGYPFYFLAFPALQNPARSLRGWGLISGSSTSLELIETTMHRVQANA